MREALGLLAGAAAPDPGFAEGVLAAFPPSSSDLLAARAQARLRSGLASSGIDVGARDRLVAATAITAGRRAGTASVKHIERIPGLDVLAITGNAA